MILLSNKNCIQERALTLVFEPNPEPPSRDKLEKAFANAEASLRLEGMTPTPFFFALKEHVLAGEITLEQAAEAINHYHRPNLDPWLKEWAEADPVAFYRHVEAGRNLLALAGTMPELEDIKRFRSDLIIPDSLLADQRFQNLLSKAETHQRKFRPKETEKLEQEGRLTEILQERTLSCWESITAARKRGMTLLEAQEEAFPMILLPDENEEN
jgi:hypothetical protein